MSEMFCTYSADRDHALVTYLYGEPDDAFARHVEGCAVCRHELAELGALRQQLAQWAPPEPNAVTRHEPAVDVRQSTALDGRRWWQDVPAWAQVAAALLFLGVSAGVANLHVTYDRDGLSVTTGWSSSARAARPETTGVAAAARQEGQEAPVSHVELTALEQQLRAEIRASSSQAVTAQTVLGSKKAASDADVMRRVQALVDDSEKREQRELALHVAEISRDVQAQRQADLVKIDRSLGLLQNNTGFEVMRQRELLNSLAVRVSQTR